MRRANPRGETMPPSPRHRRRGALASDDDEIGRAYVPRDKLGGGAKPTFLLVKRDLSLRFY
jgi:hypothetical protein